MNDLNKKALLGLLNLVVILSVALFVPAGTVCYWQGWVLIITFFVSSLAITIYLMKHDPNLLQRRVKAGAVAEKEISQKIIQSLASVSFISMFVVPALDHRFAWSAVPVWVVVMGDIFVVAGFYIVFLVFKENTFTSAIIEVAPEQKVISTGPYSFVRHPMYSGALILLVGIPIALGSWWGLFTVIPIKLVLVWRLLDEEKYLAKNLTGYMEYQQKVKYRLAPFIW